MITDIYVSLQVETISARLFKRDDLSAIETIVFSDKHKSHRRVPWYNDIIMWETTFITEFPDVMGKLGHIFVVDINKWCFMVFSSCLEMTLGCFIGPTPNMIAIREIEIDERIAQRYHPLLI